MVAGPLPLNLAIVMERFSATTLDVCESFLKIFP